MCGRIIFCLDGHEVRLLVNPCLDFFVPQPQEVDRPTLTSLFRRAGYQSAGLYPALSWDWAERAYYGFDLFLDGRDLGCDQLVAESALPLYDAGGFLVSLDLQSEIILCV